jgi:hypothetical protein
MDRRLGELQNRSGRGGEEKNSQFPPGIEPYNPDRPARSPLDRVTALNFAEGSAERKLPQENEMRKKLPFVLCFLQFS